MGVELKEIAFLHYVVFTLQIAGTGMIMYFTCKNSTEPICEDVELAGLIILSIGWAFFLFPFIMIALVYSAMLVYDKIQRYRARRQQSQ